MNDSETDGDVNPFTIQVEVSLEPRVVETTIRDHRMESMDLFSTVPDDLQRMQLVQQAWRIGTSALIAAQGHATVQRTEEIAERLQRDLKVAMDDHIRRGEDSLTRVLGEWIDPKTGRFTGRLEDIIGEKGELANLLVAHLGSDSGTLAKTLGERLGENSDLWKALDPESSDGLIKRLTKHVEETLSKHDESVASALDPLAEGSPVNRFLSTLETKLKGADEDRNEQLRTLTAALDANDEDSLLSRLMRETSDARSDMAAAMDPSREDSPMNAIKRTLTSTFEEHAEKMEEELSGIREEQQKLLKEVIDSKATRRANESTTIGGGEFEDDLHQFLIDLLPGEMVSVDNVGNETGAIRNSKVGDIVVEYLPEHQLAGSRVVFEAKRSASYKMPKALEETRIAMENRESEVGVFVMDRSRAPAGMPALSRHGNRIVVTWDREDPNHDHFLMAATHIALCVVRGERTEDEGERAAIRTIIGRLENEVNRIALIERFAGNVVRDGGKIQMEIGKMRKKLGLAIRESQTTLTALGIEREDPVETAFEDEDA